MAKSATSLYERCWLVQSPQAGIPYPSSAVFAHTLWPHKLSLLLCETDEQRASEIDAWLRLPEVENALSECSLHKGDWRDGVTEDTLTASNAELLLVEIDPMQFEHRNPIHEHSRNRALLYPDDIERIVHVVQRIEKPVVLQLSSYDVNNNNSLSKIDSTICDPLLAAGFSLCARVAPNAQMISLVFGRDFTMWSPNVLNQRFNEWLPK